MPRQDLGTGTPFLWTIVSDTRPSESYFSALGPKFLRFLRTQARFCIGMYLLDRAEHKTFL